MNENKNIWSIERTSKAIEKILEEHDWTYRMVNHCFDMVWRLSKEFSVVMQMVPFKYGVPEVWFLLYDVRNTDKTVIHRSVIREEDLTPKEIRQEIERLFKMSADFFKQEALKLAEATRD